MADKWEGENVIIVEDDQILRALIVKEDKELFNFILPQLPIWIRKDIGDRRELK